MDKSDKRILLRTGRSCEKSTVNRLMPMNSSFKVKGLFNIINEMGNRFWTEIKNQKIKILNMPVVYVNSPYLFCKYMGLHELMFTAAKNRQWADPRKLEPIIGMNIIKMDKVNRNIINAGVLEVIIAGAGIEVKRRIKMEECVVKMPAFLTVPQRTTTGLKAATQSTLLRPLDPATNNYYLNPKVKYVGAQRKAHSN